jgi:hypothetical protein
MLREHPMSLDPTVKIHPKALVESESLAALPVIAPMSFGLTLLEVLLRRGGTVEVYARRDK